MVWHLGRNLPGQAIEVGAAGPFFAFGAWLTYQGVSTWLATASGLAAPARSLACPLALAG